MGIRLREGNGGRKLRENVKKIWRGKSALGIKGHIYHNMAFRDDLRDYGEPLKDCKHGYLHLRKDTAAARLRMLKHAGLETETFQISDSVNPF